MDFYPLVVKINTEAINYSPDLCGSLETSFTSSNYNNYYYGSSISISYAEFYYRVSEITIEVKHASFPTITKEEFYPLTELNCMGIFPEEPSYKRQESVLFLNAVDTESTVMSFAYDQTDRDLLHACKKSKRLKLKLYESEASNSVVETSFMSDDKFNSWLINDFPDIKVNLSQLSSQSEKQSIAGSYSGVLRFE